MFKDKRKKPKKSLYDYGNVLTYENMWFDTINCLFVNYIKRYGKRTFMYSEDGFNWVSEYRILYEGLPF